MLDKCSDGRSEMPLAEQHQSVQTPEAQASPTASNTPIVERSAMDRILALPARRSDLRSEKEWLLRLDSNQQPSG
jgi:hypothetical protein